MLGTHAFDGRQMRGAAVEPRDRAEQADGVGMLRVGEKFIDRRALHDLAAAYITATSSQTSATTPRSWVIRMIAAPLAGLQFAQSSR